MNNAYCIVAKWNRESSHSTRAFEELGHAKNEIPGSLNIAMQYDGLIQRLWTFRCTVAIKMQDALSKPSLATRTHQSIQLDGIPQSVWDNFKN